MPEHGEPKEENTISVIDDCPKGDVLSSMAQSSKDGYGLFVLALQWDGVFLFVYFTLDWLILVYLSFYCHSLPNSLSQSALSFSYAYSHMYNEDEGWYLCMYIYVF